MAFNIDEHTGILIKKAARLFEQVANRGLKQLGVTYSQTIFLVRLWDRDGQTQIELAKSAGLKQPTVVRILDRMERDKLIMRERNEADRRVFNFYLTEKGKKACLKLEEQANSMHDIATINTSKNEIEQLNKSIEKIIENLDKNLAGKKVK